MKKTEKKAGFCQEKTSLQAMLHKGFTEKQPQHSWDVLQCCPASSLPRLFLSLSYFFYGISNGGGGETINPQDVLKPYRAKY